MPEADDLFELHMPKVDPIPTADFFARMRRVAPQPVPSQALDPEQRSLRVVTPGRVLMFYPAPRPGSVADAMVARAKRLLPSERPLNITAIGYTQLDALMKDRIRCLPHLSQLVALSYLGHNVLLFEGHPTAFEAAIRGVDALLVDSGMAPFLQKDWAAAAWQRMGRGARIRVFDRKSGELRPVVRARNEQAWDYGEPDGERSYLNCLLTTMAKRSPLSRVEVVEGRPAPQLATLAVDPEELEWIAQLPFRYDLLSAKDVIAEVAKLAKWTTGPEGVRSALFPAKLAAGGQLHAVSFFLRISRDADGRERLAIEKAG